MSRPAQYSVTVQEVAIPLSDGVVLSGRVWLPEGAGPVPAVLEYLPYRKSDSTAIDDSVRHPYFAERGYAGVRVDIRGSGDSEGVLRRRVPAAGAGRRARAAALDRRAAVV